MWDEYTPLQLLKTMPRKLNQENLSKIQMVIDADKYKNSLVSGFDLCGIYAPFCRGCDKTSIYPCAIAYIRMMQTDGMNIEIDASPVLNGASKKYMAKPEIPQTQPQPGQEVQNSVPVAREIRISEYKSVRPRPVQEIKFRERKDFKSKLNENAVKEVAVTESDEPVLILPELKDAPELKTTEEIEDTEIFVPVKETAAEPAPVEQVKQEVVVEQPEILPAPAPVKEETPAAEPAKRRIRIAVARRKL